VRKTVIFGFFASLLVICTNVYADCVRNGQNHKEGSVVDGYKCSNGKWTKT
jgi:hypothetical protein